MEHLNLYLSKTFKDERLEHGCTETDYRVMVDLIEENILQKVLGRVKG